MRAQPYPRGRTSPPLLKNYLVPVIKELKAIPEAERVNNRIEKFGKMGFWEESAIANVLQEENREAPSEEQPQS